MNRRGFMRVTAIGAMTIRSTSLFAGKSAGPVIVSAGRRVDAPNAETPRFPSSNVATVRRRIQSFFKAESPSALVCSAACGTDLLALEVAGAMHVKRYVLLGAAPAIFKKDSVTDRPGNWGEMFDEVLKSSTVDVLKLPAGQEGYLQTNLDLLSRAEKLAKEAGTSVHALVIWNEQSRGPDDVTAHFLEQAKQRRIPVTQISTL